MDSSLEKSGDEGQFMKIQTMEMADPRVKSQRPTKHKKYVIKKSQIKNFKRKINVTD